MAHTDHTRTPKGNRARREGLVTTRQPRPAPRRQRTTAAAVAAAIREG